MIREWFLSLAEALDSVIAISAGGNHSLALRADGTVVAWGKNSNGETEVPEFYGKVIAISAGASHNLALVEPEQWSQYDAFNNHYVDTEGWMGWLYVHCAPYLWSESLDSWFFMDEPNTGAPGAWGYFFK